MVFAAMEENGTRDPKRVVKVGDTPTDMQQGKAAGCGWIIGVDAGTFPKEDLLSAGADVIVKNPGEIIPLIQEIHV
jgi:phosphoglycolate phosphatase-like HAD superfamily hydrolase